MTQHSEHLPITSKRVQGALFTKSIQSPFVLYPTVTAGLGAVAGSLFGFNLILGAVLIGGATLAVGGFLTEFGFRRESNVKQILLDGLASEEDLKKIDAQVKKVVAEAADFAQSSPEPDASELWTDNTDTA